MMTSQAPDELFSYCREILNNSGRELNCVSLQCGDNWQHILNMDMQHWILKTLEGVRRLDAGEDAGRARINWNNSRGKLRETRVGLSCHVSFVLVSHVISFPTVKCCCTSCWRFDFTLLPLQFADLGKTSVQCMLRSSLDKGQLLNCFHTFFHNVVLYRLGMWAKQPIKHLTILFPPPKF